MYLYDEEVIGEISNYAPHIRDASTALGVDPAFVASVLAEESDDDFRDNPLISFLADRAEIQAARRTHNDLQADYEYIRENGGRPPADISLPLLPSVTISGEVAQNLAKIMHPTQIDVGIGNIKISTAITTIREYRVANSDLDPLGWANYYDDYQQLAADLYDPESGISAEIAATIVREAIDWFESQMMPGAWGALPREIQAGLISTYYNLGRDEILRRHEENTDGGRIPYNPGVDASDSKSVEINLKRLDEIFSGGNNVTSWRDSGDWGGNGPDGWGSDGWKTIDSESTSPHRDNDHSWKEDDPHDKVGNPSGNSASPSKPGMPEDPDAPAGPHPIILDLDGLGISVTELSQSTVFVDGDDGLEHRTAWAGVGDGVLFFDIDPDDPNAGGDGVLNDRREYVFTEWDPTATSDLEALRSVFDTNGDGVLNASDTTWAQFRVARTEPDGTLSYHTLDALGITEIDLMGDATSTNLHRELG